MMAHTFIMYCEITCVLMNYMTSAHIMTWKWTNNLAICAHNAMTQNSKFYLIL